MEIYINCQTRDTAIFGIIRYRGCLNSFSSDHESLRLGLLSPLLNREVLIDYLIQNLKCNSHSKNENSDIKE